MEGKLIDGLLSVMVEYLSSHIVYQAILLIIVHGQQPPRS